MWETFPIQIKGKFQAHPLCTTKLAEIDLDNMNGKIK